MTGPESPSPAARLVAVIPAYNEQNKIGVVVAGVRAQGLPVLVVDDGSTDESPARAEAAGAVVLRQEKNLGKGVALRRAFRWAMEHGYDEILTLDGDCQHDPEEIPRFLEMQGRERCDLLIGARNFDDMPWTRYTTNVLGRWMFSRVMGQPMLDNQSGYRLLSRRLAEATLSSEENGYEFEVDMIVICIRHGYRLGWLPIRTIYNEERSHINHIPHIVNYVRLMWKVRQQLQQGKVA